MKRLLFLIIILTLLAITISLMLGVQGILSREDFKKQQSQIETLLNISLTNQKANKFIIVDTHDNTIRLVKELLEKK